MIVQVKPQLGSQILTSESLDSGSFDGPTLRAYLFGVNDWSTISPCRLFVSSEDNVLTEVQPETKREAFKTGTHSSYDEYLHEFFSEKLWDFFSENGFDLDSEMESSSVETFIDSLFDAQGFVALPKNKIFLGSNGQLNLADSQRKKIFKKDLSNVLAFFVREFDCSEDMAMISISDTNPDKAIRKFRDAGTWIADKYSMVGVILK